MPGAGGFGCNPSTVEATCRWATSTFTTGDVLLFTSHTIHQGQPNHTDAVRISCDFRYNGLSKPLVEGALGPHWSRTEWPDIYRFWGSKRHQYYWKDLKL